MAKSRMAPIKQLTFPQLELMATVIGSRLAHFVPCTLSPRLPNLKKKLWSDSAIVLHWINSDKSLKPFVTHRITEMKNLFPASTWNLCPTDQNPADMFTRMPITTYHPQWNHFTQCEDRSSSHYRCISLQFRNKATVCHRLRIMHVNTSQAL